VIFVSIGSRVVFSRWQLSVLALALHDTKCRVVWCVHRLHPRVVYHWLPKEVKSTVNMSKEAFTKTAAAPAVAPEQQRFFIRPWLPQSDIVKLREVCLVVTHAGWGSCCEAIGAGKKVMCLPFDADQPGNAKLLASAPLQVGTVVDPKDKSTFTRKKVLLSLETVLESRVFTKSAQDLTAELKKFCREMWTPDKLRDSLRLGDYTKLTVTRKFH